MPLSDVGKPLSLQRVVPRHSHQEAPHRLMRLLDTCDRCPHQPAPWPQDRHASYHPAADPETIDGGKEIGPVGVVGHCPPQPDEHVPKQSLKGAQRRSHDRHYRGRNL
ncbi:hypothetical protein GCM10029964_089090 [Kibdelosporangium lantanae]